MILKIAVLFGSLVLAAAGTVTIEKTAVSLTEESQDLDSPINNILQNFLGRADVTSSEHFGDFLQICMEGRCRFCTKLFHHGVLVCFLATPGKGSIVLDVTVNHKHFINMTIIAPHPKQVCKKVNIPTAKLFKEICVQVKNVDLKKASGCVYLSYKWNTRWIIYKVRCFKIPKIDGVNYGAAGLDVVQDESSLKFESAKGNP